MIEEIEDNELETIEEIDTTDYYGKITKIKKKLLKRIVIIAISSIFIISTVFIEKHEDFDVVLKSKAFMYLLYTAVIVSVAILVYLYKIEYAESNIKIYKTHKTLLDVLELLTIIPVFMSVLAISNLFVVSASYIDGASMEPNYYDGEDILFWHLNVEYERFDVVILEASPSSYWIKRIIGLSGDTVVLDQGVVYVNGSEISQEFLKDENGSIDDYTVCRTGDPDYCEFNVPVGQYFVLGDNRSVSDDSRSSNLGFVTKDQLFGRVIYKFNNLFRN